MWMRPAGRTKKLRPSGRRIYFKNACGRYVHDAFLGRPSKSLAGFQQPIRRLMAAPALFVVSTCALRPLWHPDAIVNDIINPGRVRADVAGKESRDDRLALRRSDYGHFRFMRDW